MEAPTTDTLKRVIQIMKPQNNFEKYQTFESVASKINLKIDFNGIQFDKDDFYSLFPIPFSSIYGTIVYENYLYIYCKNSILHIIDLENKHHRIKELSKQPDSWQLLRWVLKLKSVSLVHKLKSIKYSIMKKKISSFDELIPYLNSIPDSKERIDPKAENLISGIISGMEKEKLLESGNGKSAFEITLKNGSFICLLDEENKIKKLFRVQG